VRIRVGVRVGVRIRVGSGRLTHPLVQRGDTPLARRVDDLAEQRHHDMAGVPGAHRPLEGLEEHVEGVVHQREDRAVRGGLVRHLIRVSVGVRVGAGGEREGDGPALTLTPAATSSELP